MMVKLKELYFLLLFCVLGCGEPRNEKLAKITVFGSNNEIVKQWQEIKDVTVRNNCTNFVVWDRIELSETKVSEVGPCIIEY